MRLVWSLKPGDTRCFRCGRQPVHQGVCRRCREWCLFGPRVGPRSRAPQAKDVPEQVILDVLAQGPWPGHSQRRCYEPTCRGECRSLPCRAPELAAFPEKVLRAKLKAMRRRGLVHGCACGCRGDWLLVRPPPARPSRQDHGEREQANPEGCGGGSSGHAPGRC